MTQTALTPRTEPDARYGYCGCGCGEKTSIARDTIPSKGAIRGKPRRFLPGHGSRGQTLSGEHKANIAASSRGELGNSWKGDDILYSAAHHRVQKALADQPCARADDTCKGPIQATFKHDTPAEFVKVDQRQGSRYSVRVEDYWPLCASHHWHYDQRQRLSA